MRLSVRVAAAVVALTLPVASVMAQEAGAPEVRHRTNPREMGAAPTAGGTAALSPITNHGGAVINTPKTYVIWYGNWNQGNGSDTPSGQALVQSFLGGIGNTGYFDINQSYGATGSVNVGAAVSDAYSQGKRLRDSSIKTIVSNAISSGALPSDNSGVYFVLTSSDVAETSGFCTKYCGWHTHGTIGGNDIKYSFVGNANRCLSGCAAQSASPNGNAGVDGMVSVIAHELEEATSDPDLNAWYDSSGAENADKCAWTFGSAQVCPGSGGTACYNQTWGGHNWEVQRNLSANDNKCYVNTSGQQ